MSLETSEFAKENGRFDQFHVAFFRRYYSEGMDIGIHELLAQIDQDAGPGSGYPCACTSNREIPTTDREYDKEVALLIVTAAPTFIIEDRNRNIGAQPIEVFTTKLRLH
jgi:predicted DsbA family dithiol-disulfide isomerase